MSIRVRTTTGGSFRRCGMVFGPSWTTVDDAKLGERFATPAVTKNSPTIRAILKSERMLVCEEMPKEPEGKAAGNGKAGGKDKTGGNSGK